MMIDCYAHVGAPRFLFLTGKGGVGITSVACASALALADAGNSVLLVSTDPASNLDEMLGVKLGSYPTSVPGVPGLFAMNIDPETAAEDYRARVLEKLALANNSEMTVYAIRNGLVGGG